MAKSVKDKATKEKSYKKVTNTELIDARMDVGNLAGDMARTVVIQQCEKAGLTVPKVISGIVAGMNAMEQKVQYSQPDSDFVYSKEMVAWAVRQKAIDQAIAILGIKAPEKSDLNVKSNTPAVLMLNFGGESNEGKNQSD